jgi:hypothetical protein
MVESDIRKPVTLEVAPPLEIDADVTPVSQTLPPIRETLEGVRAAWSEGAGKAKLPKGAEEAVLLARERLADLEAYLEDGVPPRTLMWKVRAPEGASGKFPVTVRTEGEEPLSLDVILGDRHPPGPAEMLGDPGWKLVSVKVVYPAPAGKLTFWAPLGFAGVKDLGLGWIWVYILVYVPAMFALKFTLRIA